MAGTIMWVNHFDLLPGDPSVTTSFNFAYGISGDDLVIKSSTTGQTGQAGVQKSVFMGLQVPPGYLLKGVRVCYVLSNKRSFISRIRLTQVQTPPKSANVMLDDGTAQINPGPVCVDSQPTTPTPIDPSLGEVILFLFVNFGNTSDQIVIRALGLNLSPV